MKLHRLRALEALNPEGVHQEGHIMTRKDDDIDLITKDVLKIAKNMRA